LITNAGLVHLKRLSRLLNLMFWKTRIGEAGLARPTGLLPISQTQISEVFVLAKLAPKQGDLSVRQLGGVVRPAPNAGIGRGRETRAQRGLGRQSGLAIPAAQVEVRRGDRERSYRLRWRRVNFGAKLGG
jgi:hypothetical protein